jgi:hypothetical protein
MKEKSTQKIITIIGILILSIMFASFVKADVGAGLGGLSCCASTGQCYEHEIDNPCSSLYQNTTNSSTNDSSGIGAGLGSWTTCAYYNQDTGQHTAINYPWNGVDLLSPCDNYPWGYEGCIVNGTPSTIFYSPGDLPCMINQTNQKNSSLGGGLEAIFYYCDQITFICYDTYEDYLANITSTNQNNTSQNQTVQNNTIQQNNQTNSTNTVNTVNQTNENQSQNNPASTTSSGSSGSSHHYSSGSPNSDRASVQITSGTNSQSVPITGNELIPLNSVVARNNSNGIFNYILIGLFISIVIALILIGFVFRR